MLFTVGSHGHFCMAEAIRLWSPVHSRNWYFPHEVSSFQLAAVYTRLIDQRYYGRIWRLANLASHRQAANAGPKGKNPR